MRDTAAACSDADHINQGQSGLQPFDLRPVGAANAAVLDQRGIEARATHVSANHARNRKALREFAGGDDAADRARCQQKQGRCQRVFD